MCIRDSTISDYFVICSGGSERQLRAIADGLDEVMDKTHGVTRRALRGAAGGGGWVLVDFGSVIVHVFLPSQRQYYNLEALWQEAPVLLRMP